MEFEAPPEACTSSPCSPTNCGAAIPRHTVRYFPGRVSEIGLVEVSGGAQSALAGGVPLAFEGGPAVTLRFLLSMTGQKGLEAVRYARRSLLREEWTRGREPDEPSLEDAVFSSREIQWVIRPDQRRWCLEKLEELRRRANRFLTDLETGSK